MDEAYTDEDDTSEDTDDDTDDDSDDDTDDANGYEAIWLLWWY